MTWRIGLFGDVMLGRGVAERLAGVPAADVWAPELRALASGLDFSLVNLECCISDRGEPTNLVRGKPFFFRGPPVAVGALTAIGAKAASVANNHALDFGAEALADTTRHLAAAGIAFAGAGPDPQRARSGAVVDHAGLRLGIVAVSDHPAQFAAAADNWGISYADLRNGCPGWLLDEIGRLRGQCQLVLAFPHWGPNMTRRPAPWQRSAAAEMLAAGADIVAGHSAHVFHGVELTAHGIVAYDLGDALDDYAVDSELRNDLGVIAVWHAGEGRAWLELYGIRLDYCHTRLATGEDADWIGSRLERACHELGTAIERLGEQHFRVPSLT